MIQDVTGVGKYESQLTQRLGEIGGEVSAEFTPFVRKQ